MLGDHMPAGWYDDPDRPGMERWWNGGTWTFYRRPSSASAAPAAAPWVAPASPPALPDGATLAHPGLRLVAFVLDVVFVWLALFMAALPALLLDALSPDSYLRVLAGLVFVVAVVVFALVYPWRAEGTLGQTYGKHLMGLEVVSVDSAEPIGDGSAIGRAIVRTVGTYALGLGVLSTLWDPRHQGWHDKVCNSIVVLRPDPHRDDPVQHLRRVVGRA